MRKVSRGTHTWTFSEGLRLEFVPLFIGVPDADFMCPIPTWLVKVNPLEWVVTDSAALLCTQQLPFWTLALIFTNPAESMSSSPTSSLAALLPSFLPSLSSFLLHSLPSSLPLSVLPFNLFISSHLSYSIPPFPFPPSFHVSIPSFPPCLPILHS